MRSQRPPPIATSLHDPTLRQERIARPSPLVAPLGRIFGIEVFAHATLLLLLGVIAIARYSNTGSLLAAGVTLAAIGSIFASVLLHELGHSLMARRFGIGTRRINLLPIGGVAQLEGMPEDPRQEILVALAGPLVNLVLAANAFLVLLLLTAFGYGGALLPGALGFFATANVFLFAFNLLPAFPMDGGRVLRAYLARRMNPARATSIAARIGRVIAIGLGILGLFGNPLLILIALFIGFGATQEEAAVRTRERLRGALAGQAMATEFHVLSPTDDLRRAGDLLVRTTQRHYPVVVGERIVGMLYEEDLLRVLPHRPLAHVGEIMRPEFETVRPTEGLEHVFSRLFQSSLAALPVVDGSRLVGWITRDHLRGYLTLRGALGRPA